MIGGDLPTSFLNVIKVTEGKGEIGQTPYNPGIILKMLLLFSLYDISVGQVEILANDISSPVFLIVGTDESAPDPPTLTPFRNMLINNARTKVCDGSRERSQI